MATHQVILVQLVHADCCAIAQEIEFQVFSLHMGITSNNIAELGAVRQGLLLVWELGFKFIHLEIDSIRVLDIPPIINPILCDCGNLMERDQTIQVYHIFLEANGCADALAKRGNKQLYLLETYDTCPAVVFMAFV